MIFFQINMLYKHIVITTVLDILVKDIVIFEFVNIAQA